MGLAVVAQLGPAPEWLAEIAHGTARGIEIAGLAVIVIGGLIASGVFFRRAFGSPGFDRAYQLYRADLGRAILLGLEFLVAADIIGTVAVDPTFENLGVLAAIVLIRTFLSFALEVEIEGHWPWKDTEVSSEHSTQDKL